MVLADVSMVLADVSLLLERCIVARDKIVNGGYIQSKHTPFSPAPSNIQVIIEITLYSLHNYRFVSVRSDLISQIIMENA